MSALALYAVYAALQEGFLRRKTSKTDRYSSANSTVTENDVRRTVSKSITLKPLDERVWKPSYQPKSQAVSPKAGEKNAVSIGVEVAVHEVESSVNHRRPDRLSWQKDHGKSSRPFPKAVTPQVAYDKLLSFLAKLPTTEQIRTRRRLRMKMQTSIPAVDVKVLSDSIEDFDSLLFNGVLAKRLMLNVSKTRFRAASSEDCWEFKVTDSQCIRLSLRVNTSKKGRQGRQQAIWTTLLHQLLHAYILVSTVGPRSKGKDHCKELSHDGKWQQTVQAIVKRLDINWIVPLDVHIYSGNVCSTIKYQETILLQDATIDSGHPAWRPLPSPKAIPDAHIYLQNFLRSPLTASHQEAQARLHQAFATQDVGPSKAALMRSFHDLDILLFDGVLRHRVHLLWIACPDQSDRWAGRLCFPQTEDNRSVRARIDLDPESSAKRTDRHQKEWGTMIHEMLHAYIWIMGGYEEDCSCGAKVYHGPKWDKMMVPLAKRLAIPGLIAKHIDRPVKKCHRWNNRKEFESNCSAGRVAANAYEVYW